MRCITYLTIPSYTNFPSYTNYTPYTIYEYDCSSYTNYTSNRLSKGHAPRGGISFRKARSELGW